MNTVFIYALVDPRNEEVRYIGKSKNPKRRWQRHITRAKNGVQTHCYNWIRVLLQENLNPDLLIIEEVSESEWAESERRWIAYYRREYDLTNTTDGGNAPPKYKHTEKSRKRIGDFFRGKKLTEEHRKKISSSKKRMPHPYRGKQLSEEHKRKLAESQKGRKHSEETKRKMRESAKRRNKNPEYIEKLREYAKNRPVEHQAKINKALRKRKPTTE